MPIILAGATKRSWMVEGPARPLRSLRLGLRLGELRPGTCWPWPATGRILTPARLQSGAETGGTYNDFPVLLDKDANPVLGFAVRKLDNSNWDKIRVVLPTGVAHGESFRMRLDRCRYRLVFLCPASLQRAPMRT